MASVEGLIRERGRSKKGFETTDAAFKGAGIKALLVACLEWLRAGLAGVGWGRAEETPPPPRHTASSVGRQKWERVGGEKRDPLCPSNRRRQRGDASLDAYGRRMWGALQKAGRSGQQLGGVGWGAQAP